MAPLHDREQALVLRLAEVTAENAWKEFCPENILNHD
jgi:hypothetical protein